MLKEITKICQPMHLTSHSQVVPVAPPASKTAPSQCLQITNSIIYFHKLQVPDQRVEHKYK